MRTIVAAALVLVPALPLAEEPAPERWVEIAPEPGPAFDAPRARELFDRNCRLCHGADGRGDGVLATFLRPRPRDLTRGVFRFRSTPSGTPPTDGDLLRTLTRGLRGTPMFGWPGLPLEDRRQLVLLVKSLSPRFATDPAAERLVVPPAPPATPERIEAGRFVWERMKCATCHGDGGKGDGPAARTSLDDQGAPSLPFDLTRSENLRAGRTPEDLYRTLFTGLDGTAMPSYSGAMSSDEAWNLAHYVRTLFADVRP